MTNERSFQEQDDDDKKWAMAYCAEHGLIYLSHETYCTMTTHDVYIAVEDFTGRYELRLSRHGRS